jgi:hypothetical protein
MSKSGPGVSRRSAGNRSRSVGRCEPWPASGSSQPSSSPTFHRIAKSAQAAREGFVDVSPAAIDCRSTSRSATGPGAEPPVADRL